MAWQVGTLDRLPRGSGRGARPLFLGAMNRLDLLGVRRCLGNVRLDASSERLALFHLDDGLASLWPPKCLNLNTCEWIGSIRDGQHGVQLGPGSLGRDLLLRHLVTEKTLAESFSARGLTNRLERPCLRPNLGNPLGLQARSRMPEHLAPNAATQHGGRGSCLAAARGPCVPAD